MYTGKRKGLGSLGDITIGVGAYDLGPDVWPAASAEYNATTSGVQSNLQAGIDYRDTLLGQAIFPSDITTFLKDNVTWLLVGFLGLMAFRKRK